MKEDINTFETNRYSSSKMQYNQWLVGIVNGVTN